MAELRPRGSSVFSGLTLIFIGVLLLLHNYRGFELTGIILRWWPLILIFWGALKIYERTAGSRTLRPGASRISGGEVFLVLGLLVLVGILFGFDQARRHIPGFEEIGDIGEAFASSIDVAPKQVPPNARITVRGGRGDIAVRASDEPEIRVSGKVNVKSWTESAAKKLSERVSAEIVKNGDGYDVNPTGGGNSRVSVDLDITVPKKAVLAIHSEKGDVSVSDMISPVNIDHGSGDVDVRATAGDVSLDMRHGDAKISDTKGDVKISGHGGSVEVVNATGSFTINGEFVGPIRAERVAKGVRFVSHRTDLTLTQLSGHMEAGSGNLDVVDAPGNLILRTRDEDITIENAGGKVNIDDRNGHIEIRFSFPPKDDIQITNSSAPITLTLPESSSFEILADCHSGEIDSEFQSDSLKLTTDKGDSHLEGKYGRGRGPKIILKTTYGSISIHKTS